jgi:tetratricopeptide (TPR) repeat protein
MAGEPETAISLFHESLTLARQLGDKSYEAENLHMIGFASTGTIGIGDYQKALDFHNQALAITESTGLVWHHIFILNGLGYAQGCVGDYERGLATVRQGSSMAEMMGLTRVRTFVLEFQAELLMDLNLGDKAAELLNLGIELSRRIKIDYWLPRLQARLAICRLRQGDLTMQSKLLEALKMAQSHGQGLLAIQCLEGLAELHLARGEVEQAGRYAGELLAMTEKNGMWEMVARGYRWRGAALMAEGKLEDAEEVLELAAELAEEVGRVRLQWDVHESLSQLYDALGRDDLAREHEAIVQGLVQQIRENLQQPEMRAGLPS